ncbi:hypothetical protein BC332_30804 [Capsicum chinense]|nr:hypothetical protein BC332_30804 [Capsicum chinense]
MPMGVGFFKKIWSDSETWDLGLVMNEGKFFELSPPAAYVVFGLIKIAKPRFPLPFTYVVENNLWHSISDLTKFTKLCFSCSRPVMPPFIWLPPFISECLMPIFLVLEDNRHKLTLRVSLPAQEANHSARRLSN